MNKCEECINRDSCRINYYVPKNAVNRITGCWQYRPMSEKKKIYLTRNVVDKAGGIERIERFFDYQCEVAIIPDAYETVAQGSD